MTEKTTENEKKLIQEEAILEKVWPAAAETEPDKLEDALWQIWL